MQKTHIRTTTVPFADSPGLPLPSSLVDLDADPCQQSWSGGTWKNGAIFSPRYFFAQLLQQTKRKSALVIFEHTYSLWMCYLQASSYTPTPGLHMFRLMLVFVTIIALVIAVTVVIVIIIIIVVASSPADDDEAV